MVEAEVATAAMEFPLFFTASLKDIVRRRSRDMALLRKVRGGEVGGGKELMGKDIKYIQISTPWRYNSKKINTRFGCVGVGCIGAGACTGSVYVSSSIVFVCAG